MESCTFVVVVISLCKICKPKKTGTCHNFSLGQKRTVVFTWRERKTSLVFMSVWYDRACEAQYNSDLPVNVGGVRETCVVHVSFLDHVPLRRIQVLLSC